MDLEQLHARVAELRATPASNRDQHARLLKADGIAEAIRLLEAPMPTSDDPLAEAYHAIYDVKDRHLANENIRVAAYNALHALESLLDTLGLPTPARYDGQGRS